MRQSYGQVVADRTVRWVLLFASVTALFLLAMLVCLLVLSILYPDATHWLLGGEPGTD